jgi:hypothetical protein
VGCSSLLLSDEVLGLGLIGKDVLCDAFPPSECASQKLLQASESQGNLGALSAGARRCCIPKRDISAPLKMFDTDILLSLSTLQFWFPSKLALS